MVCWFLGKNLSFVSPVWKLHNPCCHTHTVLVSPWTRKLGQTKPFSKKCDLLQYCRAFLRPCYLNIHDLVAIKITLLTFHSTKSRIDLLNYQDKLLKFQFNLWNYAEFNAMFLEKPFYSAVKSRGYRGGLKGYYYSSDFSRIGEKTLLLQATTPPHPLQIFRPSYFPLL